MIGLGFLYFLRLHLFIDIVNILHYGFLIMGAQWLSGNVLDSRPRGSGLEPHRCHCVVVLEQDTFTLA